MSRPCGKIRYFTRAAAKDARRRYHRGEHMQAYICRRGCDAWHLGHLLPAVANGQLDKDAAYRVRPIPPPPAARVRPPLTRLSAWRSTCA